MLSPLTLRVYYEDTDAAGIVYYANYLKFAERGRTETLRGLGIEQQALKAETGVGFVVRRAEIDFIRPAKLDDLLTIESHLVDIKAAQLSMQQRIRRGGDTLVTLQVHLATLGPDLQPVRIPKQVRDALQPYLAPPS